jgi:hypothetical protein
MLGDPTQGTLAGYAAHRRPVSSVELKRPSVALRCRWVTFVAVAVVVPVVPTSSGSSRTLFLVLLVEAILTEQSANGPKPAVT